MNAATNIQPSVTLNLPRIGAEWPGKGGIFAGLVGGKDSPFFALILPTDPAASFEEVELGTYGTHVEGADSKSDGLANTQALAQAGSELCQKILALEIGGHRDWYLPAANEAHVMATTVPELFEDDDYYWTSTQDGARVAFVQDFEIGGHGTGFKGDARRASAVRKIQLSD